MAQQVLRAASTFQEQRTDGVPHSVAIDLGDDTLVITLKEVVSPAEKTLSKSGTDAVQMREIYRHFIADALASLRQHMKALSDEYESRRKRSRCSRASTVSAPDGWDNHDPASSEDQRLRHFVGSATSDVH